MQVWTQRIVFGAEIKTFGLSEKEVREVANQVIGKEYGWDVDDVRDGKNGKYLIYLELNNKDGSYSKDSFEFDLAHAKKLAERIEAALQDYKLIKRYLETYYNCNGHSEAREIMRKVGIPVIS